MSGGADWTTAEQAKADYCVRAGMAAWQCADLFPSRSSHALQTRFKEIRDALGIPAPNLRRSKGLIASSEPRQRITAPVREGRTCGLDDAFSASRGSRELLKRQLQTGQHFIGDRARFTAVCASVGIAA